jgi:hypothetical protein
MIGKAIGVLEKSLVLGIRNRVFGDGETRDQINSALCASIGGSIQQGHCTSRHLAPFKGRAQEVFRGFGQKCKALEIRHDLIPGQRSTIPGRTAHGGETTMSGESLRRTDRWQLEVASICGGLIPPDQGAINAGKGAELLSEPVLFTR